MTEYWEPCSECGSLNLAFETEGREDNSCTVTCRECGSKWEDFLD